MLTQYTDWLLLAAPNPSWSWGIILFMMILGLIVTLSPPRRSYEIKKPKDE
jgi:hypothetical protein